MAAVTHGARAEHGLTLTEVAVVMVLGTLIMTGIVGFYLSSQRLWLDASTQVITQREAALVTAAIRDSIRRSGRAEVSLSPDSLHMQLSLFLRPADNTPYYNFWWSAADSLVYSGSSLSDPSAGPMVGSHVELFQVQKSLTNARVDMRLRSAGGESVASSAFAVMKNR
jgi:Tfp pilus assembly protein PilV